MKNIVQKYDYLLNKEQCKKFNLGKSDGYILPSLNLMPKVHKLNSAGFPGNEEEQTARPIVTGHSWCTMEASKFLQEELKFIINRFKSFMLENNYANTLLKSGMELVEIIREMEVDCFGSNFLVSFDFKDLYTNILYEDAVETLNDLFKILKLHAKKKELILELYCFCNDWNYFNVGNDVFNYKQDKGVSMGCYLSKEISDLILMYSELIK